MNSGFSPCGTLSVRLTRLTEFFSTLFSLPKKPLLIQCGFSHGLFL
jgi:hypothetical protein